MATSKDFCNYVLDQLSLLDDITARPMMGEFLLYHQGVLFGGVYDERLLLKETSTNADFNLPQVKPYDSAKRTMYYIENLEDKETLRDLILATYSGLVHKK